MKRVLLGLSMLMLCAGAFALEVVGVKVPETAQVGTQALVLNGTGVRTKFFFKIYVAALYLPQKQVTADAVIADEHEHRMSLHILHELSSKKLYSAFFEAMDANHTHTEMEAMDAQLKQMQQIFDAVNEVKPGDLITLDYQPATGTQISVNGTARGTIAGAAFNRALLKIWLGAKPVQDDMKKGLLGG